jgi:hypothetical protein
MLIAVGACASHSDLVTCVTSRDEYHLHFFAADLTSTLLVASWEMHGATELVCQL